MYVFGTCDGRFLLLLAANFNENIRGRPTQNKNKCLSLTETTLMNYAGRNIPTPEIKNSITVRVTHSGLFKGGRGPSLE